MNSVQVQVLETPIKSASDKREYRHIKLPNGLRAVLIHKSDENENAAACLAVDVGSFEDPREFMGLAHFLEHLLFMGCEKYPEENSFDEFFGSNGGETNASTDNEMTKYEFEVSSNAFSEGLDRFASMFQAPLLRKDAVQRERQAVNSEYLSSFTSENRIFSSVILPLFKETHAASQFICGNTETLKGDDALHREVLKFHKKYAANKMFLSVQSSKSLDEMQSLVVQNFSGIKAESEEPSRQLVTSLDEIVSPEFSNRLIYLKPKTSTKTILMTWTIPSVEPHYKANVMEYLKCVFHNDSEGGLMRNLKDNQLINSLRFTSTDLLNTKELCTPQLSIELSNSGAQRIEEVLESVFSYLLMLQQTSIESHQTCYEKIKNLKNTNFNFVQEKSPMETVTGLNEIVFSTEPADLIRAQAIYSLLIQFDETILRETIEKLNERKFNLIIADDEHEVYDKKTKFYDVDFQEVDFPERYQQLWNERKSNPNFFLEKDNPYVAGNFEVFADNVQSSKHPVKIINDDVFEVWHKLDDQFKSPEVYINIQMLSPNLMSSLQNTAYLELFNDLLVWHLNKETSRASVAGIQLSCSTDKKGLKMEFNGFNDKIDLLVNETMKTIKNFEDHLSKSTFDFRKVETKKSDYADLVDNESISDHLNSGLTKNNFSLIDLYNQIDGLNFEAFKAFLEEFFANLKIKMLVFGNYKKEDAQKIVKIIQANIECGSLVDHYNLKDRRLQIPLGSNVLRLKSLIPQDDNSRLASFYEIGPETLKVACMTEVLCSCLEWRAFDYLRTQEQLGYAAAVKTLSQGGISLLEIYVESQEAEHTNIEVQDKIDIFMNEKASKTIEELADEDFESVKTSKISSLTREISTMEEQNEILWSEIMKDDYVFDRREMKAKIFESLTKSEFQDFFKSVFGPGKIRKLNIQVIGNKDFDASITEARKKKEAKVEIIKTKQSDEENVITDIEEFKSKLVLHPIVKFSL